MTVNARALYHEGSDFQFAHEEILLGAPTSYSLTHDPKHLAFVLSRYKFCAKMLEGKASAMEVGSGDGFGLPLIAQAVGHVHCVDWDKRHIDSIERRLARHIPNMSVLHFDLNDGRPDIRVDAAFSIDVLEHIEPDREHTFLSNLISCLPETGVLITGTPNADAAQHASKCSEVQHINLKTHSTLKTLMEKYFANVFMFGMNDEVLHTGYGPMCHYIWAVASGVKAGPRV